MAVSAKTHEPLVAICCRFYNKPGSKAISLHQIYLCDLHGGHRKQITFDRSEKTDLRWVGTHRLAWYQSVGALGFDNIGERWPWIEDKHGNPEEVAPGKLVEHDLTTGRTWTIATGYFDATEGFKHFSVAPRGTAVYFRSDYVKGQTGQTIVLKSGSVRKFDEVPAEYSANHNDSESESSQDDPWNKYGYTSKPDGKQWTELLRGVTMSYGDEASAIISSGQGSVRAPLQPDSVWPNGQDGFWFLCGMYAASAGSDQWIYEASFKTSKTRLIANDVLDIDFDPKSRYWAASSNDKGIATLGTKKVWARELWVGDKTTGKQWPIASGAVHGENARIQPQEH